MALRRPRTIDKKKRMDKNFTHARMQRRMAQIEESVARYLHQLDSADRKEPSLARTTKTTYLKEKIAKLKEEMRRLEALDVRMLTTLDQQISLTDPMPAQWQQAAGAQASWATTLR